LNSDVIISDQTYQSEVVNTGANAIKLISWLMKLKKT